MNARIHLSKTLCAMRWIALLNGNLLVAQAIEFDQEQMGLQND